MGKAISTFTHKPYTNEKDVLYQINSYSAKTDSYFTKFEKEYNLLKYIEIREFQQLLYNFDCTVQERNDQGSERKEYDFEMTETMWNVFTDKKIIKHFLVYPQICDSDKKINISKQFYNSIFNFLYKNFKHYNKKISKTETKTENKSAVKKLLFLSLVFLYCRHESLYSKVLFLFNLFADENEKISRTHSFETYLFFLLLFPSNILIFTIYTLGQEFEELSLKQEDFQQIYDAFQVADCERLMNSTLDAFFKNKESLSLEEFSLKLKDNDWILTPSGIRKKLEDTNIA